MNTAETSLATLYRLKAYFPAIAWPDPAKAPALFEGAVLHVRLEGVVRRAEDLAKTGREGAEQFSRVLNSYLARLLAELSKERGQVSRLEGDELVAFFPQANEETPEACQARAMKAATAMTRLSEAGLRIKPGLGYGLIYLLQLGTVEQGFHLVLAGPALVQAQANPGNFSSPDPAVVVAAENPTQEEGREASPEELGRLVNWLPSAVWQKLRDDPGFGGDWRRAVVLSLQFAGPNYQDANGLKQLQEYFSLIQNICNQQPSSLLYRFEPGENGEPHRVLLIFGTLLSFSDEAERALRVAMALRRLPAHLNFIQAQIIGIASGTVFAGRLGTPERQQFGVVGESLAQASRIIAEARRQSHAPRQGTLLVDAATSEGIALNFLFSDALPGVLKPRNLLTERKFVSALKRYWKEEVPLVGRDDIQRQLEQIAAEALGGKTKAILLTGPEGIGKSALLGNLSHYWLTRTGSGAIGICYEWAENWWPYLGWAGVMAWLCGFTDADTRMARVARINLVISQHTPEYPELVAPVQQLLNLTPFDRQLFNSFTQPGPAREHFFALFSRLIQSKSAVQPLLIELEDLQWCDKASLSLLHQLITQVRSAVLFSLTSRQPGGVWPDNLVHIPLGSLDAAQCQQLLAQHGANLASEQLNQLFKLTQGNPLQLIEAISYWQQYQRLPVSLEELTLVRLVSEQV